MLDLRILDHHLIFTSGTVYNLQNDIQNILWKIILNVEVFFAVRLPETVIIPSDEMNFLRWCMALFYYFYDSMWNIKDVILYFALPVFY